MEDIWSERRARYYRSMTVAAGLGVAAALVLGVANAGQAQNDGSNGDGEGFKTAIKRYLKGVPGSGFETEPILSAGDLVPEADQSGQEYQMVGIPDGLGATREDPQGKGKGKHKGKGKNDENVTRVFMNHELGKSVVSDPRPGRPQQQGAFVSEYRLTKDGSVLSGRRAYDFEFQDDEFVDTADSPARAFSRFCSGFMADSRVGFDRPIYLTGEETSGRVENGNFEADTFDRSRGAQTVAIFENDDGQREIHALSDFGFFAKENTIVAPNTGNKTVAFSLEDGPQTPDSQLYMYVGEKQKSGTVLERNGLVGGKVYVFVSSDPSRNSEATFENGTIEGRWVEIPRAERENEIELEAASDKHNAFGFVRIEDGAFGSRSKNEFFFNSTGDSQPSTINRLGMNYRLQFDRNQDPEQQKPHLSVVYNADQADATGQDISFSPDNLDAVGRQEFSQEDGTASSRPEMENRNRDGSVWRIDGAFTSTAPGDLPIRLRIAELVGRAEGGRDNVRTSAGVWESSGIIDASEFFGGDGDNGLTLLLDVQAHRPTNSPCPGGTTFGPQCTSETVEDGQLLFLRKSGGEESDSGQSGDGQSGSEKSTGGQSGGEKSNNG